MPRYQYTKETYVDPYPGKDDAEVLAESPCSRCGGVGGFDYYNHIDKGICYRCDGDPEWVERWTVGQARQEAQRQVRATNKFRMERAKADVKWAEGIAAAAAERPEWATLVRGQGVLDMESDDVNEFVVKLATQVEQGKGLTPRQLQAGADAIAKYNNRDAIAAEKAAAKAATPAVEAGRRQLVVTVVSTKEQEGNYGTTWKMLVEDTEGRRYWGTIPTGVWNDMHHAEKHLDDLRGKVVTMTATVEASDKDHTFGFFSRPAKAKADMGE